MDSRFCLEHTACQLGGDRLHELLATSFQNTPLGLVLWKASAGAIVIVDWNRASERIFGWQRQEVLGRNFLDFLPAESSITEVTQVVEQLSTGLYPVNATHLCRTRAGGTVMISWFNTPVVEPESGDFYVISLAENVTERLLGVEALRESEEKYRDLFENANDAIFIVDTDFRYRDVNRKACELLGFTREELQGMRIPDLLPPEQLPRSQKEFDKIRSQQPYDRFIGRIRCKDGSYIDAEVSSSPIIENGEVVGSRDIMRDISERKRGEDALRRSEERFRSLIENALDIVTILKVDGTILYEGPSVERIVGYLPEELVGHNIFQLIHRDDCTQLAEKLARIVDQGVGATNNVEFRFQHKDGHWLTLEAIGIHSTNDDGSPVIIAYSRDITFRKEVEGEIRRFNEELEERVRLRTVQLEVANQELAAFSYSVSHDLRAPLVLIDGFSQALQEDHGTVLNDEGGMYLERIRASCHRMTHLIEDMLNLSRVTSADLNRQQVDLSTLAQQVMEELREQQPARQVIFEVAKGVVANGDFRLLRLVLENLLGNSWKYTGTRSQGKIEFAVEEQRGERRYSVRDNGVGFDMAFANRLFSPFCRLHGPQEFPGSGIGLATVQRIIHRHGGRLWAEARVDQGATFYFTLPAAG
ncbi:MAG TPA: PAS domain S-box protein [Geobacterales bacterium]|nr:PAS domain S-box protein [Geobacterales bacterium]